jgi:hypothetical protein
MSKIILWSWKQVTGQNFTDSLFESAEHAARERERALEVDFDSVFLKRLQNLIIAHIGQTRTKEGFIGLEELAKHIYNASYQFPVSENPIRIPKQYSPRHPNMERISHISATASGNGKDAEAARRELVEILDLGIWYPEYATSAEPTATSGASPAT